MKLLDKAVSLAQSVALHVDTDVYKYRHGAVIFRGKKVIGVGWNKRRRTPVLYSYGYKTCMLHAESAAILDVNYLDDIRGSDIMVVRICKTKLGNSKPCEYCMAMIKEVGIRNVYYSDRDGRIVKIKHGRKNDITLE